MSANATLMRCRFVLDDGEVLHDETTLCELGSIAKISKGIAMLGSHGVLEISFDPPVLTDLIFDEA